MGGVFTTGNRIFLTSIATGKTLRINPDGSVDGNGGHGPLAQFLVEREGEYLKLSVSGKYLRIVDNDLNGLGTGGEYTLFRIHSHGSEVYSFESARYPGQYVGVLPSGIRKPPNQTATGPHGQFRADLTHTIAAAGVAPPSYHGRHMYLQSVASGQNLRIHPDGRVDGLGGTGPLATFKVHQHAHNTMQLEVAGKFLRIIDNDLNGLGTGGEFTFFRVHNLGSGIISLESVKFPGQYVGVLPDGCKKPPALTATGPHGQFRVFYC
eukprot:TRINITY_DN4790_c0_g1_i3.p1 TRINITY_DN4790_c0_g1~~TRINITY_DN4790_c0_g1_i3.p1  ORF type:complete len:265 (-),score=54.54 TRINITY_DN4790_c0_g1_i3:70-864(-)